MSPSPTVTAPGRRTPRPGSVRLGAALVVALVLALVAGCGVRLETPPPAAPTPDARELARQRAAADAVALEVLAGPTDPSVDPAGDPVAAARAAVASAARLHHDLLGGLYPPDDDDGADAPAGAAGGASDVEGGPDTTTAQPDDVTATPEPAGAPPDVLVDRLAEAAVTARADAAAIGDGALARLLGSVSVNRLLSAARLSAAAGLTAPSVPGVDVPASVPEGVRASDLAALIHSEDAAGYALEVVAAQHGGDTRRRAGERAATHRARAQAWAELAQVDGTGLDPRQVAYALPGGLEDPATAATLVQGLETSLAAHYAGLVAAAAPDARPALVDAVAEATAAAVEWGALLPALPGLPEHAEG